MMQTVSRLDDSFKLVNWIEAQTQFVSFNSKIVWTIANIGQS